MAEVEDTQEIVETSVQEQEPTLEFPFKKSDGSFPGSEKLPKVGPGFQNQVPLQAE